MESYEPTNARRRLIVEAKLRGLEEQRYSLELDARANARLGEAESVAAIKKDMAKIEGFLDLFRAELESLGPAEGAATNGQRHEELLQK